MAVAKLFNAALDEGETGMIIRGSLDLNTLSAIQVDDYQREILPDATIKGLKNAYMDGESSIPDLDLGMRGMNAKENGDIWVLHDPAFVIDGLQRLTAAIQLVKEGAKPRVGAIVHLDSSKDWEIERFRRLNANRSKVSTNVLLRNMRDENEVVATLHRLSTRESDCVLHGRVCWQQSKRKTHFLTAYVFLKTVGALHAQFGGGHAKGIDALAAACEKICEKIGRNTFRANVRTFFDLIEESWGISTVEHPDAAPYLRSGFLCTFARILSDHDEFWRDNKLFVDAGLTRKIKQFKVLDPLVIQLAGSGGQSQKILYQHIVDHINRGKTSKRLISRKDKTKTNKAS